MSKQTWEEIFAPVEQAKRNIVLSQTWGHLHPEYGTKYKGFIVFAYGDYGDLVPIKCQFDGLSDSPWFFGDLQDFVGDACEKRERGAVYRFDGTYKKFKNGNCLFSGKIKQIVI